MLRGSHRTESETHKFATTAVKTTETDERQIRFETLLAFSRNTRTLKLVPSKRITIAVTFPPTVSPQGAWWYVVNCNRPGELRVTLVRTTVYRRCRQHRNPVDINWNRLYAASMFERLSRRIGARIFWRSSWIYTYIGAWSIYEQTRNGDFGKCF